MDNKNKFNSQGSSDKSFEEVFGSWELNQERQKNKTPEEAYAERLNDLVKSGDKEAFEDYKKLDEHFQNKENGIETSNEEEPVFKLNREDYINAIAHSSDVNKMFLIAEQISRSSNEEVKQKYQKQLSELTNKVLGADGGLSVNDWHDKAQWDVMQKSKDYNFRSAIVNQIWEKAMKESSPKAKTEEVKSDKEAQSEELKADKEAQPEKNAEKIQLSEVEEKFDELFRNDASAAELTDFRSKWYRETGRKAIEEGRLYNDEERDINDRMIKAINAKFKLEVENHSAEKESSKEQEKGRGLWLKIGAHFSKHPRLMKIAAIVGLGAAFAGIGNSMSGAFGQSNRNSEPQIEQATKTEASETAKDILTGYADTGENEKTLEVGQNGKYDAENNDYNKEGKENQYSIGTRLNGMSIEEAQKYLIDNPSDDNIEYMGQFFVEDSELAQKYLGIDNSEVDNLVDKARAGDSEAFKKLNDGYKSYFSGAKIISEGSLGDQYAYSMYVNGDLNYAHAEGQFGGEYFEIKLADSEETILVRKDCQQKFVLRDSGESYTWYTPRIEIPDVPGDNGGGDVPGDNGGGDVPGDNGGGDVPGDNGGGDNKFTSPQDIYSVGQQVDQLDAGKLEEAETPAEAEDRVDATVIAGAATEIPADNSVKVDVDYNAGKDAEYEGSTTIEAQNDAADQQVQAQAEEDAKADYEKQKDTDTVTIEGVGDVSLDDIRAAQNQGN